MQFDLEGELLPREETSLGPVDYRRIPAAVPVGYHLDEPQPRHVHNLETGVSRAPGDGWRARRSRLPSRPGRWRGRSAGR